MKALLDRVNKVMIFILTTTLLLYWVLSRDVPDVVGIGQSMVETAKEVPADQQTPNMKSLLAVADSLPARRIPIQHYVVFESDAEIELLVAEYVIALDYSMTRATRQFGQWTSVIDTSNTSYGQFAGQLRDLQRRQISRGQELLSRDSVPSIQRNSVF